MSVRVPIREGSPLAVPTSGPMPWIVRVVLRRTGMDGALILPRSADVELMRLELDPSVVARLGGPRGIPRAMEPDRIRFARAAIARGYRDGWAVEVDVERGRRRGLWTVPGADAVVTDPGGLAADLALLERRAN